MLRTLACAASLVFSLAACTTVDPYTGQARVDEARTAALLGGLALAGAAAYAIDKDNDDDDKHDDYYHQHSRVWHPVAGIDCYDAYRKCYRNNGKFSEKWTRRVYSRGHGRADGRIYEQGYSRYDD